jgi:hypothetical protein
MIVFNLACESSHAFEGWFASADDFDSQAQRGLVSCPLCGSARVEKKLHAPRINLGAPQPRAETAKAAEVASPARSDSPNLPVSTGSGLSEEAKDMLRAIAKHVADNTEDVGRSFAEEARKIHYNEVPARGIRGVASREEAQALADEGIEVAQLPFPIIPEKQLN